MPTAPTQHDDSEPSGIPGITARDHALLFMQVGWLLYTVTAILGVFALPHLRAMFDHFERDATGLCKWLVRFGGHNVALVAIAVVVVGTIAYRQLPRAKLYGASVFVGLGGAMLTFSALGLFQAFRQMMGHIEGIR